MSGGDCKATHHGKCPIGEGETTVKLNSSGALKPLMAALTALVLAAALAACGGDSSSDSSGSSGSSTNAAAADTSTSAAVADTTTAAADPGRKLTVGVVANNLASPSVKRIGDAFERSAKARGWTVDMFDNKGDMAASNNQADQFLQRGVDAIVNINGPNSQMSGVIDRTHQAGKPFVSVYGGSGSDADVEIGTNESINSAGITQGLVDRLHGRGNVLVLKWNAGGAAALLDRYATMKAVLSNQPGIRIVKEIEVKVPGQVEDAYTQATNFLKGDRDIDAVWIAFDEIAPSVVRALEQADLDKRVFIVGFNGNPFAWDMIREGSPYVMEPANPFEPMGEKAVDMVAQLAAGRRSSTPFIAMRPCMITPETVPAKGEFPDWKTCPFFTGDIGDN
jgi:ABC-type sugar transport system substrate-binding protein